MIKVTRFLSVLLAGVLVLAAVPSTPAHAGKVRRDSKAKKTKIAKPTKSDAAALLADAVMRRGMADFEGSRERLEAALKATKDGKQLALIRLYMGANLLDMEKEPEARAALLEALGHDPTLKAPVDMKTAVRKLLSTVRAAARGTLAVSANLPAQVAVDGKARGKTPYEAAAPIGLHRVRATVPGGSSQERKVMVYPGRMATVRLTLEKYPEPGAGDDGGRLWTWVAGAAGLAAAGAGIGVWLWADSSHGEFEELVLTPPSAQREERLDELESSIRSKEYAAYALWGTAGLLGAAAVVLFIVEGGASDEKPAASAWQRLTITPVAGQTNGLLLRGSF